MILRKRSWCSLGSLTKEKAIADYKHQVVEFYTSLFFQEVQNLSSLQTALRFLPEVASGAAFNILTGFFAHKFHAGYLVSITTLLSAIAPLLMAITNPTWSYWYTAFWAMLILPISADSKSSYHGCWPTLTSGKTMMLTK